MEMGGLMRARKVVAMAVLIVTITMSSSGAQTTECVNSLTPCASYLNTTSRPPASCCDPLKEAVRSNKVCLCSIFNNPSLLKSLGVTAAQASSLPTHCNITGASPNLCSNSPVAPVSSPTTATAPTPAVRSSAHHLPTPRSLIYILSYLCIFILYVYY